MAIIESIIDKYYFYSTEIVQCFLGIFAIFAIIGFIYTFLDEISSCLKNFIKFIRNKFRVVDNEEPHVKTSKTRIKYNINKLIYKVIYSTIVVGIGKLLCLMGAKLEIEYVYFNAVAFIFIVGATVVYGILLCIMFRQILLPMQQSCRYIQFFIFLELFLLAVTQHLDFWEWVTATLGIISAEMMTNLLEKLVIEQKRKKEKKKNKGYDYPDPDLYPTRRRQLERFIEVLKEQRYEPYAVMISGEWGKGKTSFVKALEKELEENCFKWIYAGSEKTVSEIMSEISSQILEVLKENNIFLDRKDLIEKYFLAFSDLLEDTALKPLKKLASAALNKQSANEREYLNSKLDKLDKVIYLIIDDLDRCDAKYRAKMFGVIRESMELHNCKTIFLVDKTKFLTENQDAHYIEKYVNYTLDLCDVDYSEIVKFVIEDILDDEFIQSIDDVLLRDRSPEQIREIVRRFPIHLIEKIETEISIEKERQGKKKDDELERSNKEISELQELIIRIKRDITIPRKVKNYLKGIKRDADAFSNGIDLIDGELLAEDWFGTIIKVQYVKNFMPEVFNDIRMNRDIFEFCQKYNGYTVNVIFNLKLGGLIHNEKKEALLNLIIYKIDVIDFSQVKTTSERRLFELRNDRTNNNYIGEYIEFAETYDDLNKILDIYEKQEFKDNVLIDNFIEILFEAISQRTCPIKPNTKEFLDFSKRLMECLIKKGLSSREKIVCVSGGSSVIGRAVVDNARLFINILLILFDVTTVWNEWNSLAVRDIDDFYDVLRKIDKGPKYEGLEDETNKLSSIRTYFGNLKTKLEEEQYESIRSDIDQMFSDAEIIFEICEFWDNIEYTINNISQEEDMVLLKKYFILEDGYQPREDALHSVSNLIEALTALKKFYISKEDNYEANYSNLLLTLSYRVILRCKEQKSWFGDKKEEIAKLLLELSEIVSRLDQSSGYYYKDTVSKIRIFAFKFNEYCEKEAVEGKEELNE